MFSFPFKIIPKHSLGVDIGTSSIRVAEMSRWGARMKLENYGEIRARDLFKKPFRTFEKRTLSVSDAEVARAIKAINKEAGIKIRSAAFSIPDFSTFFTNFTLPPMTKEELPQAVSYEARQHIPVPLSDVTLDWQIIEGKTSSRNKSSVKILLVAVPNEIVEQYQRIASLASLKLSALEAEVFGLARALIREDERIILLLDIGAQSTTASIVDNGVLKLSHSFDISGNELTGILAKSLGIDHKEAEDMKQRYGLVHSESKTREVLLPLIDLIVAEIKKIVRSLEQTDDKKIKKIIIAGGTALIPGLIEYFSENFGEGIEVEQANPFCDLFYPPILERELKRLGPSYAVVVGTALRGIE